MEIHEKFEKVGFTKGLQKANELFDESKIEVKAEFDEHLKKFTEINEHSLTMYKMGFKYALELIQYNLNTKLGKEQIKSITEWQVEK